MASKVAEHRLLQKVVLVWAFLKKRCGKSDNRGFHNLFASLLAALAHRDSAKVIRNSFQNPLSVWRGF